MQEPRQNTEVPLSGPRPSDRWIPWYFVAFFVVLIMISAGFVAIAVTTHTGVVTEHAYQKGLDYNDTIAAAEKMHHTGWAGTVTFNPVASALEGNMVFTLQDKAGKPVENAAVMASVFRPTQSGYDFAFPLDARGAGVYSADVVFPLSGQWEVRFFAEKPDATFQMAERLVLVK
ncbi:FixH family protein [Kordiimonas pumila]|uniref:FixH family protein n=1 Tax=Kordiimonas pumila TaxID=2161677 RepID=A0ABV7D6D1_9PROT|nr:FixH family protein [Kordiimonas pumila]